MQELQIDQILRCAAPNTLSFRGIMHYTNSIFIKWHLKGWVTKTQRNGTYNNNEEELVVEYSRDKVSVTDQCIAEWYFHRWDAASQELILRRLEETSITYWVKASITRKPFRLIQNRTWVPSYRHELKLAEITKWCKDQNMKQDIKYTRRLTFRPNECNVT